MLPQLAWGNLWWNSSFGGEKKKLLLIVKSLQIKDHVEHFECDYSDSDF